MTEEEIRAIFLLARIPILNLESGVNPYWQDDTGGPLWIVTMSHGKITVHWRKRVIAIDWSGTPVRYPFVDQWGRESFQQHVTRDEVTKDASMVHAHGLGAAVSYLTNFRRDLPRWDYLVDFFKRKDAGELTEHDLKQIEYYATAKQ